MIGKTVPEVFPEIADQGIYELLNQVFTTGEPFIAPEFLIQLNRGDTGVLDDVYFELIFRPMRALQPWVALTFLFTTTTLTPS